MEESSSLYELQENLERFEHREEAQVSWNKYLALTTAILAVVSALASLQSSYFSDQALLAKNNAVLLQSKASDQWSYYQAKGVKKNIAESFSVQSRDEAFKQQATRYSEEQKEIEKQAREFEKQAHEANELSEKVFEKHHRVALGVTFFQIAVALSALSALLKRKSFWVLSLALAAVGIGLSVYGTIRS